MMVGTNGHGYNAVQTADRPLGDLFQDLAQDARSLVNLELALAKSELSDKAAQAGKSASFIAAGGLIIYAGLLAILAAVVIALSNVIPLWLSALIVGVIVALIGYLIVRKGMQGLKGPALVPTQTIGTLKDDKEWVQEQVNGSHPKGGGV